MVHFLQTSDVEAALWGYHFAQRRFNVGIVRVLFGGARVEIELHLTDVVSGTPSHVTHDATATS